MGLSVITVSGFLPDNPFSTINTSTVVTVSEPNSARQTGDIVRFYDVKSPVGGVAVSTLELQTTLAADINATTDVITLNDSSQFPSAGYVVIEKVNSTSGLYENEVIQYTSNTGTNAPFRGKTPKNTTATTHSLGAKVRGGYSITMVQTTMKQAGEPSTITVENSYTFNLVNNASSAETGGGSFVSAGPINDNTSV